MVHFQAKAMYLCVDIVADVQIKNSRQQMLSETESNGTSYQVTRASLSLVYNSYKHWRIQGGAGGAHAPRHSEAASTRVFEYSKPYRVFDTRYSI